MPKEDVDETKEDFMSLLEKSIRTVGILEPIVRTKYGIRDGKKRKTIADKLGIPCPEKFDDKVETIYDHIRGIIHSNLIRDNSPKSNKERVMDIAKIVEANTPPGIQITGKKIYEVAGWPGSYRTFMRYLPKKYKEPTGPKGEIATLAISEITCPVCQTKMEEAKFLQQLERLKMKYEDLHSLIMNMIQPPTVEAEVEEKPDVAKGPLDKFMKEK